MATSLLGLALAGSWTYIFLLYEKQGMVSMHEPDVFIRRGELVTLIIITSFMLVAAVYSVIQYFKDAPK